jgi:hypothetical protein
MGEIVREEKAGGERAVELERRRSKEFACKEVKKLGSNKENDLEEKGGRISRRG